MATLGGGRLAPAVGTNHFGTVGYDGPCPAGTSRGRYVARIYALDDPLGLDPGVSGDQLLATVEGRSLASGRAVRTFAYPGTE